MTERATVKSIDVEIEWRVVPASGMEVCLFGFGMPRVQVPGASPEVVLQSKIQKYVRLGLGLRILNDRGSLTSVRATLDLSNCQDAVLTYPPCRTLYADAAPRTR